MDPLAWLVEEPPEKPETVLTKRTLINLPIVLKFFPSFKVDLHKQWAGLPSKSINDEREQLLHPPEADSFFGDDMSEDDDDGEILWQTKKSQELEDEEVLLPKFTEVSVIVKLCSLNANGVEFSFPLALRDCVLVPGTDLEDSLFVSLKLGFLLLIRLYYMPKDVDPNITKKGNFDPHSYVYKPFVVQWWKTLPPPTRPIPDMDSLGALLRVHPTGLAVVSASAANVFRIYSCIQTELGVEFLPHYNVPLEGNILQVCFGASAGLSTEENLLQLLTLSYSAGERLDLNLFQWYASESFPENCRRLTLPLTPSFTLPVFIVALARNSSFLFVCPTCFVIITSHNIILADYSFPIFTYDGAFPTAFAYPESPHADSSTDEILVATDSGVIYSVTVSESNASLHYTPLVRLPESISTFTFVNLKEEGFIVHYANDNGGAKKLHIQEPLGEVPDKIPYSEVRLLRDYKNWAPLVDICVIDAINTRTVYPYASQEIWAISGYNKRAKLTNLSVAYPLRRDSQCYNDLRKTVKLFHFRLNDSRELFFASMVFSTKLLELDHAEFSDNSKSNGFTGTTEDVLTEIREPSIYTDETTLFVDLVPIPSVQLQVFLQITASTITFTNLEDCFTASLEDKTVLHVDSGLGFLFMVIKLAGTLYLEVVRVAVPAFDDDFDVFKCLSSVYSTALDLDVSVLKTFTDAQGNGVLMMGTYDEKITLWPYSADDGFDHLQRATVDLREHNKYERFPYEFQIASDFHWLWGKKMLLVGTQTGYVFRFHVNEDPTSLVSLVQHLRLGSTPVSFTPFDESQVLVALRNLWLFEFEESNFPTKVAFDERSVHATSLAVSIGLNEPGYRKIAMVRDDGVILASLFCHKSPCARQISIGEAAKRLIHLENINVFAFLCASKDPSNRLRFADRKSFRMLPLVEFDNKLGEERSTPIFDLDEKPICALQWEIERNERVSKKLIVGCSVNDSQGSLKILDYSKIPLGSGSSSNIAIKVTELYSISQGTPISCIAQIGLTIFIASENMLFSTSYLLADKKLRPFKLLMTFPTDIVSMTTDTEQGRKRIIVSTKMDSVFEFECCTADTQPYERLEVIVSDMLPKAVANHVKIGDSIYLSDKLHSSIHEVTKAGERNKKAIFKTALIARLYKSLAVGPWANECKHDYVLSVGVTGEIVVFNQVNKNSTEIEQIYEKLSEEGKIPSGSSMDALYERLNRPFSYKLTGKAFQGIYKPFFNLNASNDLIDYDLEDIERASTLGVLL